MAAVCGPLFGHAIGPLIAKRAAIGGQRRRSGAVPTSPSVKIMSDKASGEAPSELQFQSLLGGCPSAELGLAAEEHGGETSERPRGDRFSAACPLVDHWGHSAACSRIVFDV